MRPGPIKDKRGGRLVPVRLVAMCIVALALWARVAHSATNSILATNSAASVTNQLTTAPSPVPRPNQPTARWLPLLHIAPGFGIQVVAEAPMIGSPAAIAFDENGRLFVAEFDDLGPSSTNSRPGRVRLLEDATGAGVFDSSTIFADGLPWPSALACYNGGVFVGASPLVIYLKDTKHDGVADVRNVPLTRVGPANPLDRSELPNNFNWGPDHRIHCAIGPSFQIPAADTGSDMGQTDLRSFDPRSMALTPETGSGQTGLCFDDRGRKFTCDPTHPLRMPMYAWRYAARNPFFVKPAPLLDVLDPAAQPARPGVAGSRTSVPAALTYCGCVVYRGSAFPSAQHGNIFVADPGAHAIRRIVLQENGLEPTATPALEKTGAEFVVGDLSFHPVQLVNGPDGALYIADSGPAGRGRGRILRLAPDKFKPVKFPQLGKARTYDLVAALAHTDGWRSDTAARLLYERQDKTAVALLMDVLRKARLPMARLRALRALDAQGAVTEEVLLPCFLDPFEEVRLEAVRLAQTLGRNGVVSDPLWTQLKRCALDPSIRVRYQLAFTMGELKGADRVGLLANILSSASDNPWIRAAVLSSLSEDASLLLGLLLRDASSGADPTRARFLNDLVTMIGVQANAEEVRRASAFISSASLDPVDAFSLLSAFSEGLHRAGVWDASLAGPGSGLDTFYSQALNSLINSIGSDQVMIEAVRLLSKGPYSYTQTSPWFLLFLGSDRPAEIQRAAIDALAVYDDPGVTTNLLARWPVLSARLRQHAVAALLTRPERAPTILSALEYGPITPPDIPWQQANWLRTAADSTVSALALRLLGPVGVRHPEMRQQFRPALALTGVPERGRRTFETLCAGCHQAGRATTPLGPDLTGMKALNKDALLAAIVEPNTLRLDGYTTSALGTKDGRLLIGIVSDENANTVTLRQPGGVQTVWPRLNLQSIEPQSWSLMPEGLVQDFSLQDMADLLEYLRQ